MSAKSRRTATIGFRLVIGMAIASFALTGSIVAQDQFVRGDANGDTIISVSDLSTLFYFLAGDTIVACQDSVDVNDDGLHDINDAVALADVIFFGLVPPPPFPLPAGDPTADAISCGDGGAPSGSEIDHVILSLASIGGDSLNTGPAVYPGQTPAFMPIVADSVSEAIRGYSVILQVDDSILNDVSLVFDNAIPEQIGAEYIVNRTLADDVIACCVLFEQDPPFESISIGPGESMHLASLRLEVNDSAEIGGTFRVRVCGRYGHWRSELVGVSSEAIPIAPSDYAFPIISPTDVFLRGDVDGDLDIDIGDVISLLVYHYTASGETPAGCPEAFDVDDSDTLDIVDPFTLLQYLFDSGNPPPAPFPFRGVDSTGSGC